MFIMYRNHHYTRNLSTTEYMKHRRSITGCVERKLERIDTTPKRDIM